jgi:hypothetical protein
MRRNIFDGWDDADAFGRATNGEAMALGKLDDIWDVATIGSQTRKALQRHYYLFKRERTIISIE